MSHLSLSERLLEYEEPYNFKITKKLPIVIRVNGRKFSKLTRNLPRPFCPKFMTAMAHTMMETIKEIDGAIMGYQFSDEISFIVKNDNSIDTDPWFNNKIQEIVSVTSSIVTYNFFNYIEDLEEPLDLVGPINFYCKAFPLPNISETYNYLLSRQHNCLKQAINSAIHFEFTKKFSKKEAHNILLNKDTQQRVSLLMDECDINFHEFYPAPFRHGISTYRKQIDTEYSVKNKWFLDFELDNFLEIKEEILSILHRT